MPKPIGPDAWYHIKGVSEPSLSPDGRRLAYVLSWFDGPTSDLRSRLMMMRLPEGDSVEFTQGKKDAGPWFSPDGRLIAFLRPDERNVPQVWLMGADGGEARQLTSNPGRVSEIAWAPDSRRIAYVADVDPEPLNGAGPHVKVVRHIRYRADTLGWRGDAHRHVFVIDISGRDSRQVTDGDWDDMNPSWSADGQHIAFISGRREDADIRALTETYVVPAGGGTPEMWSDGLAAVAAIMWSPDGKRLVVAGAESPDYWTMLNQSFLYVLEPGRKPRRITDDSVKPVTGFPPIAKPPKLRWTPDGRILFLGDARGQSFVFSVPAEGGELRPIAGGKAQASAASFDREGKIAAVVAATVESPGDMYLVDIASGAKTQVTEYNRAYLSEHTPGYMSKWSIKRGAYDVECRLLMPPDFDESKRYPLVLDVHGGPNSAFYDAFNPVQQILATAGYLVLAVNPRGSSTYGDEFMRAVIEDWGGEDYLDQMAAVDAVCKRRYVDAERIGVHGYSYGGFMSAWMVAHTDRFKAAVVGAPVVDLPSMYGTSDIGVSFGEYQWGGTRHEQLQKYIERSPITYAPNIKTPVLLLHGEADYRCPIEQSELYFTVLKRLGKTVEFVRFPGCSHLFLRAGHPKMRQEYAARVLAWFDKYLKGE